MVTPTQKSGSDRRARRALLWLGTGMLLALASGCTITRTTTPAPPGTQISRIYVQRNEAILMKELHDEIIAQLAELGVDAQTTTGPRPPEAVHLLTYTANWRWDFAMVLTYFQATLLENQRILGRVEYDSLSCVVF
ncbi:MAG TPA: hypothetical protein VHF69_10825, partial [Candidatus Synoicihabitans sp.]|nr:hypothetical protein [Candidatus Synoicihabitans sp.]